MKVELDFTPVVSKTIEVFTLLSSWQGWYVVAIAMIVVYLVAAVDILRKSKRDRAMSRREFNKNGGPQVEIAIWHLMRKLKIEEKITDKQFNHWCHYFGWRLGWERFQPKKKIVNNSKLAKFLKEQKYKLLAKYEKEANETKSPKLPG